MTPCTQCIHALSLKRKRVSQGVEKKKMNGIMAMSLPKMGGKKKFVAKIWEEIFKKVLRSQYFYNTFTTNHR